MWARRRVNERQWVGCRVRGIARIHERHLHHRNTRRPRRPANALQRFRRVTQRRRPLPPRPRVLNPRSQLSPTALRTPRCAGGCCGRGTRGRRTQKHQLGCRWLAGDG